MYWLSHLWKRNVLLSKSAPAYFGREWSNCGNYANIIFLRDSFLLHKIYSFVVKIIPEYVLTKYFITKIGICLRDSNTGIVASLKKQQAHWASYSLGHDDITHCVASLFHYRILIFNVPLIVIYSHLQNSFSFNCCNLRYCNDLS